jgi:hypothetical protein
MAKHKFVNDDLIKGENIMLELIRNFNDTEVKDAIKDAEKGLSNYLNIMDLFHTVDVKKDSCFQKIFKKFYQLNVARKSEVYLLEFFSFLQNHKCSAPEYTTTLKHFHKFGKVEYSFVSKLLATINPGLPVWDSNVRAVLGFKNPTGKNKIEKAGETYDELKRWYKKFLPSEEGCKWRKLFDKAHPESESKITPIKKIDFILWQLGAKIKKD